MIRFKRFLTLGVVLGGLALAGFVWAAPLATESTPQIRVNRETNTLSVVVRDREIKVVVIPMDGHDNPVIEIIGWIPDQQYRVAASDTAPVIFIDLYDVLPGFKTAVLPVDMGWVTRLRLGHHPDRLRIALDGRDPDFPKAEAIYRNDRLVISLEMENRRPAPAPPAQLPPTPVIPAIDNLAPVEQDSGRAETRVREMPYSIRQSLGKTVEPGTTPDSRLFQEAITLFDNRQWAMSLNKVQQVLSRYPQSPYAEKARFLLTEILTALYADDPAAHYRELALHFEDVLNRYPDSPYRGAALLGLARLHREMGNHAEALAYYELARNHGPDKDGWISRQAMLDTAKIHRAAGRTNQALVLLEDLLKTPGIQGVQDEALLEIAKIRYEQNFFNESLNLLTQLASRDTGFYFLNPEVSLYTGNNYFQLGRHDRAVPHLLHYYNAVPKKPEKDIILARVGDALLQDGRISEAVRCFLFVVEKYPDTRGAALSWLRLAEQKEKDPDGRIPISYPAKQIYEKIRDGFQGQAVNDPLALLAILKLSVLYHDEQRYSDSLKTLHLFFENNPDRSLLENGRFALKNVVEAMIQEAYEEKDYGRVIDLYVREAGPVLPLMNPDPGLLMVARAYRHSGNSAKALELYHKLTASMPLEKTPDDVLFFTGKDLYESSRPDMAEQRLVRLIEAYPQSPFSGEALNLMGRILIQQKKFREAVAVMTRALSYPLSPCDRTGLLVRMSRAALAGQDMETVLTALENARKDLALCPDLAGYLGDQIGDLYVQAHAFDKAAAMFARVLEMADPRVEKDFIQYKAALSLWRSGQQDAGRALFETLAAQNDPFWSRLAREHLAAAEFDRTVR